MWDEFVIGGDVQETSKKNVLKAISDQDMIQEVICTKILLDNYYFNFDNLQISFLTKSYLVKDLEILFLIN